MKRELERLIELALKRLLDQDELVAMPAFIQIAATKDKKFGDFSSNIALVLAKTTHYTSSVIAEKIVAMFEPSPLIKKVEICEPGFINFFLAPCAYQAIIATILAEKEQFGRSKMGREKKVLLEFVSASPVDCLYQNQVRQAIFGRAIAGLLDTVGFRVATEYYVDDVGLPIHFLAVQVWQVYLSLFDDGEPQKTKTFTREFHHYLNKIALNLKARYDDRFYLKDPIVTALIARLSHDLPQREREYVVKQVQALLGPHFSELRKFALSEMMQCVRADLSAFGISFDHFRSAESLLQRHIVQNTIRRLEDDGLIYLEDDVHWFRATTFGDGRDRVLVRADGSYTHLAYDLAYHLDKFERGFDLAIDIFDFSSRDYATGIRAGLQSFGYDPEQLTVLEVEPVHVVLHHQSTRCSLKQLTEYITKDELYFQLLMRRACHSIEFDCDHLSQKEFISSYVQYAVVRILHIFTELNARGLEFNEMEGVSQLHHLVMEEERLLLNTLSSYPEMIVHAALQYEPHLLAHYLRTLAAEFHLYYNACLFLVDDNNVRQARLVLIAAIKQVLGNGCKIMGVHLPTSM